MPRFSATEDFRAGGRPFNFRPVALTPQRDASDVMRHVCERLLDYDPGLISTLQRHLQNHVNSLTQRNVTKFVELLSNDELFIVAWYTSDIRKLDPSRSEEDNWWFVVNAALRAGNESVVKQHSDALTLLLSACQKLARAISGDESEVFEFYRGLKDVSLDNFPVGERITWPAFSSASLDPDVALSFCGGAESTLLKIFDEHQTFAVFGTLSEFPNEKEVVFLPGTVIEVKRTFPAGKSGIKTQVQTAGVADFNLVVCKVLASDSHSRLGRAGLPFSVPSRIKASDLIGELRQLASSDGASTGVGIDRDLLSAVVSGGSTRNYRLSGVSDAPRSVSPNPRLEVKLDRGIKNPWNRFQHEYVRLHNHRRVTKEELVDAYHRWKNADSAEPEVSKSAAPSTKAGSVEPAKAGSYDRAGSVVGKKPVDSGSGGGDKDGRSNNAWNAFQAEHKGEYDKAEMLDAYHAQKASQSKPSQSPPPRTYNPTSSYADPNARRSESDGRSSNSWNLFQSEHKGEFSRPEMLEAYHAHTSSSRANPSQSPPARSSPSTTPNPRTSQSTGRTNGWNEFQSQHQGQYSRAEMQQAYYAQSSSPYHPSQSPPARSTHSTTPNARTSASSGRSSNTWNDFQSLHRGEYNRAEMQQAYHRAQNSMPSQSSYSPPAPSSSSGSAGRSSNSWNDFQAQNKGKYSREEMREAYQKSKR